MRLYSLLCCFIAAPCFAGFAPDKPGEDTPVSVINFQTTPSAIVHNCVNAISGDYFDTQLDLVMPGAHPLVIQHLYSSSRGWTFNHYGSLHISKHAESEEAAYKTYNLRVENGGSQLHYEGKGLHKVKLSPLALQRGLTNCASEEISGKTNLKNYALHFVDGIQLHHVEQTTGNGSTQVFQALTSNPGGSRAMTLHVAPTGNRFQYLYTKERQLSCIRSENAGGGEFAHIDIKYTAHHLPGRLEASDGRQVRYEYTRRHKRNLLTSVTRPDACWNKFTYAEGAHSGLWMTKKEEPNLRGLEIEYYLPGKHLVAGQKISISAGNTDCGRVKHLKAPVGENSTPIVTHSFIYQMEKRLSIDHKGQKFFPKGTTTVLDAYGNKTDYVFNKQQRLASINKYRNGVVYTHDALYWGKEANEGNLVSRVFSGDRKHLFCRYLQYTACGNVVEEQLFGNLTGRNKVDLVIDAAGVPQQNGCEVWIKRYYNDDSRHLLLVENDGRKQISYSYTPTGLVSQRFVHTMGGEIIQRQFYEYDGNSTLIKEIIDDGTTHHKDNLSGVTERHIRVITPRRSMPIGLPEAIEEYYLDLKTGQEHLVHKSVNTHALDGRLLHQDHYDADNVYAYSLNWTYDAHGNLEEESNPAKQITKRKYDENHNLIFEQGPRTDTHKEYLYDFSNRCIAEVEVLPSGKRLTTHHQYNYLSQKTATIDPYGNKHSYEYDDCGRVIQEQFPPMCDEEGRVIHPTLKIQYNALGHPIHLTDANGNVTVSEFTLRGQPYYIRYADGSEERKEYTLDGLLESETAKDGTTHRYQYDCLGRVTEKSLYSKSGELLSKTTAQYSAFQLIAETDAMGNQTQYRYDGAGRLIERRKGDRLTQYRYDSLGRRCQTIEYAAGSDAVVTLHAYDVLNRIVEERIEDLSQRVFKRVQYAYDLAGNRSQETHFTEAGKATTETEYNTHRKAEKITDALGNVTHIHELYDQYNAIGQCVPCSETIDPLGNILFVQSDAHGRPALEIRKNAFGEVIQKREYTYDAAGNRLRSVDHVITPGNAPEKTQTTRWEYDLLNRVTAVTRGTGTPEQRRTTVRYNAYGQKEVIAKPDGILLQYTYDAKGRLHEFFASDRSFHYRYTYDLNDNPTLVHNLIDLSKTERSYTMHNQIQEEILENGLQMRYEYDPLGRIAETTLPDHSRIKYRYEGCYLKEVQRLQNSDVQYTHLYTQHDLAGQVTAGTLLDGSHETFAYDLLERPVELTHAKWKETICSYDPVGNLLSRKFCDAIGEVACQYKYDALYQLSSEQGVAAHDYTYDSLYNRVEKNGIAWQHNVLNQLLDDGVYKYQYDFSGNLLEKSSSQETLFYTYDALNRLQSIKSPQWTIRYRYDAFNRRVSESSGGETDSYLYHGQDEIGACRAGKIAQLRILGTGKGAEIGAAIALEIAGAVYMPLHDHNGNVTTLLSQDGVTCETYRYTAFGEEVLEKRSINPWRFSSKRVDDRTGLVYFGRRYYDPQMGRWLTQDPLAEAAGPNLYAYVNSNPLTHVDQYGLFGTPLIGQQQPDDHPRPAENRISKPLTELVKKVARIVGRALEYVGRNFVPVPIVRDVVEVIGAGMRGQDLSRFVPTSKQQSYYAMVGDPSKGVDGVAVSVVNGVLVSEGEIVGRSYQLHVKTGAATFYFYKASHGFIQDCLEWAVNRMGIRTEAAYKMEAYMNMVYEYVGGAKGNGVVYHIVHSHGAELASMIAPRLSSDVRSHMSVTALGSPIVFKPDAYGKVSMHMNRRDPVQCCDLINYTKARCSKNSHVTFHDCDNLFDQHSYTSYGEAVRGVISDINNDMKERGRL